MIIHEGIEFYPIKNAGLKDYYYISKTGDVLSTFWKEPKILSARADKDGYLDLGLVKKDGKRSPMRVHRLVALTFIENSEDLPVVNHKNGIVNDNRVDNLEWCTVSYNTKHGYEKLGVIASRQKIVKSINTTTGEEHIFESMGKCAEYYGVDSSIISRRISGATKNPSTTGKLKGIKFENLGYANVTTIETTEFTREGSRVQNE